MSMAKRFSSTWSSIALLIFFADIFFDVRIFGYSGILVAIFMWITGGIITGILFGQSKEPRTRTRRGQNVYQKTYTFSAGTPMTKRCAACGVENGINSVYCTECGSELPEK